MSERPTGVASHGPTGASPVVAYGSARSFLVISHRSTGVNPVVAGKNCYLDLNQALFFLAVCLPLLVEYR